MNLPLATTLFIAGLVLVIYFAEKLVKGIVGTSAGFGVSAFVISVVFKRKPSAVISRSVYLFCRSPQSSSEASCW